MKNQSRTQRPLILVTNDDGIDAKGLWVAVEAVLPLGEVLVVVPDRQWSGAGRAIPYDVTGRLSLATREVAGEQVTAYAVDASPTLAVVHGVVELAPRRPSLVVSGINFGSNAGRDVAMYSGTIGAALEGEAFNIPALAVSLEMRDYRGDETADYTAAIAFTQRFARRLLTDTLPNGVDTLKISISSVWFATYNGGVFRFDGATWTHLSKADGLTHDQVRAVAVAPDGTLWFGFKGAGVARYVPTD